MALTHRPRSMYGITRIDQPEKKNHGYYVRITHKGVTQQKYFPDKSNGGQSKALSRAKNFRDTILEQLPIEKQKSASLQKRKLPRSGMLGVTYVIATSPYTEKGYEYWQAAWCDDATQKNVTVKYSIARYGSEKALSLAKCARVLKRRLKATSDELASAHS